MSNTQQFTIRVSAELWQQMQTAMEEQGYHNLNAFVRQCIRAYLEPTPDTNDQLEQLRALVIWNSLQMQVLCAQHEENTASPRTQLAVATQSSKQLVEPFLDDQEALVRKLQQYLRQRDDRQTP